MISLKIKVHCADCGQQVEKLEARALTSSSAGSAGEARYQCFDCFKRARPKNPDKNSTSLKFNLYCERCRYKFTSARQVCPYCNESDYLEVSGPSAEELLSL